MNNCQTFTSWANSEHVELLLKQRLTYTIRNWVLRVQRERALQRGEDPRETTRVRHRGLKFREREGIVRIFRENLPGANTV